MVGQAPILEHHGGIECGEISKTVGNHQDTPVSITGDLPKQFEDLLFGLGVEPTRHLIAKQERWAAAEFHGQSKAALLTA